MDIVTLLGLVIGVTVVILAIMTGSELLILLNLPGFLIVCGGTFAATLIRKTSPGTGASKSQSRLRLSKADRGF